MTIITRCVTERLAIPPTIMRLFFYLNMYVREFEKYMDGL